MTTDEKLRWMGLNRFPDLGTVPSGIPADVCHPHVNGLTVKTKVFRKQGTDLFPIDVPIHASQGSERSQGICNGNAAKIARVPYLVARVKMLEYGVIKVSVRIRKQSYSDHIRRI